MDDLARGGSDYGGGLGTTACRPLLPESGFGPRHRDFLASSDSQARSFGRETPLVDFDDYRDYLLEFYRWKRRDNPRYSYRLLAAKLGMDHSYVHRLVHRKQHLSEASVARVCKVLGLDPPASDLFAALVRAGRSRPIAAPGGEAFAADEQDRAGTPWERRGGGVRTRQVVPG